jgi:hypothetical protein
VFALFNLDAPSSDLINADYWFGLPISYRRGPWSYLVRLYHQSSHLGDEFILGNPGVNRVNLSYEELEGLVSYEWERWRIYGGGGYLVHSEPELAPKQVHAGAEYVQPGAAGKFDLIAAVDVRASEELGWDSSRSYQVGLNKRTTTRRVRLMLEHFNGHSPMGCCSPALHRSGTTSVSDRWGINDEFPGETVAECAGHTILRDYCGGVKPEALRVQQVGLGPGESCRRNNRNLMVYRHYKNVKRVIRRHGLPSFQYHARRINNWKSQAGVPWL